MPANTNADTAQADPLSKTAWRTTPSTNSPRPRLPFLILLTLFVICAFTLQPEPAYGRAGGGGRYFGGGSFRSSRGSFSSSSRRGGSGNNGLIILLLFRYPYIGLPLLALFLYLTWKGKMEGQGYYQGRVINRARQVQDQQQRQIALTTIQEQDPSFAVEQFLARTGKAFEKVQVAWASQKLDTVRPFISDGIHERFSLQIQEQKELGYRDQLDDLTIKSIQAVQVECDALFSVITVRITASAVDTRVSLADGSYLSGTKSAESFTEFWSFLRRRGVTTDPDKKGLLEGNCPNCAAPIEMNAAAQCQHCNALLRSGEYDWVLGEITQACEWEAKTAVEVPGVKILQNSGDTELNLQHLEDRASVMFWRRMLADRHGKADPLRKIATDAYCDSRTKLWHETIQKSPDGSHFYYGDCAVGGVTTVGILPGKKVDRALVEIRWSGTRFAVDRANQTSSTNRPSVFRSLYVLERKAGVKSSADQAVSSAHCPQCGAPEAGGASNACEFCGAVLNQGNSDWVLSDTPSWSGERGQELLRELRSLTLPANAPGGREEQQAAVGTPTPGGAGLVAWMIKIMLADGVIDPKEEAMLEKVAAANHLPPALLTTLFATARSGELDIPEPRNELEARTWLTAMARMALADGRIDPTEAEALKVAGKRLGMSAYDIKMLIQKQKATMYKEAKAELRKAKMRRQTFEK